ncbi:hypothetical protein KQI18_05870 [Clostridioides mangenotii]|uniref:hypothetical protein n=1 Tax=Metaclostridioides mangenotii TaxID=1540 RepID=UPI001C111F63|nr:hypothetical protein [Clostridioides mangenotii]MBU5307310.1 hypothetical protein [Clostridioides mangenotii]
MSKKKSKKSKKSKKNKKNYKNNNTVNAKKDVKEKEVDPLNIIIARSHIVVAIILLVCAALTFTDIIPFSVIAIIMLVSLVFQQCLVGYGSYKQKNYYRVVYSIAMVVLIIVAYLFITGKLELSFLNRFNLFKKSN